MSNNQNGYLGKQNPNSKSGEFNSISFLVEQILSGKNTATLVQIKSVTNSGGLSAVGFVDVLPLVNQLDGNNNSVPHKTVFHLPYFRLQGGTDAIILDPKIGDIGIAVFADRDISTVKATKAQSNPSSKRKNSKSDGLYLGGFLNAVPVQYIQFTANGINIVSPSKVTVVAPTVEIDASTACSINSPIITLNGQVNQGSGSYGGNSAINGTLTATVDVIGGGKSLKTHVHSDPQGGNTGPPV